jgi:hypothetical protein
MVVDVGAHAAACAGTGIETNNPEIKVVITNETIFGRAALIFMRTKPKITFTSLFRASFESPKRKSGVGLQAWEGAVRGDDHP